MKVKFTVQCEMEERWIDDFCSFLNYIQSCGEQGHSALIGFYADGDGDFRPKFKFRKGLKTMKFKKTKSLSSIKEKTDRKPEVVFDAG